jgi:hypothetical protein
MWQTVMLGLPIPAIGLAKLKGLFVEINLDGRWPGTRRRVSQVPQGRHVPHGRRGKRGQHVQLDLHARLAQPGRQRRLEVGPTSHLKSGRVSNFRMSADAFV